MSKPLRVTAVNGSEEPRILRWNLEQLIEALDARAAKEVSESYLLHGRVWEQWGLAGSGWRCWVSCPQAERESLQQQYQNRYGNGVSPQRLQSMPAAERVSVAETATDPELLQRLAADPKSYRVRAAVAANDHTSEDTLAMLASDDKAEVRQALANRSTAMPRPLWQQLAEDNDEAVQRQLTCNPCCDPQVLEAILDQQLELLADQDFDLDAPWGRMLDLLSNPGLGDQALRARLERLPLLPLARTPTLRAGRQQLLRDPATDRQLAARLHQLDSEQLQRVVGGLIAKLGPHSLRVLQERLHANHPLQPRLTLLLRDAD